ncbi:MAG: prolipoprotein diacylglyceryl transferase [Anaerolineales bacterium]|nr:prolipoprotein diacylglyceryl transferase [Anaerolineales bacterium]
MVDFYGPLDLRMFDAYAWIFAIGALISLAWLGLQSTHPDNEATAHIDAGLSALLTGLLGARIGYVATHLGYFSQRLDEAFYFWQGGLSWAAGAAGALIGLAVYVLLSRRSFWADADLLAIPAAIVASAAWFGCLVDRCAYGFKTAPGILAPPAPDMIGNVAPRWPTQALGGLLSLILVGTLYWLSRFDLRAGLLAALSLSLVALIALGLSFTRGDPMPALAGFRLDGLGSAAVLSLGLTAVAVNLGK